MWGITLEYLHRAFKSDNIIRVMPNTPALVGEGMSVMCHGGRVSQGFIDDVKAILASIGSVLELDERHMDAVTALSGSGPAFIAYFIDAMAAAGATLGLGKEDAATLSIRTLMGTARLIVEGGVPPAELIRRVASPGGTTEAGLKVLDTKKLKTIVEETLDAASRRSAELALAK